MMTMPLRLSGVIRGEMDAVTMATEPGWPPEARPPRLRHDGLRSRGHVDARAIFAAFHADRLTRTVEDDRRFDRFGGDLRGELR